MGRSHTNSKLEEHFYWADVNQDGRLELGEVLAYEAMLTQFTMTEFEWSFEGEMHSYVVKEELKDERKHQNWLIQNYGFDLGWTWTYRDRFGSGNDVGTEVVYPADGVRANYLYYFYWY